MCFLVFSALSFCLPDRSVLFFDSFDAKAEPIGWITSELPNYTGEWKVRTPPKPHTDTFERLLYMKTQQSLFGISKILPNPVEATPRDAFILQFEMRASNNITCSGAYIKLFSDDRFNPSILSNETVPFISFGPDICHKKNRVLFHFQHRNPSNGATVEKHLKITPMAINDNLNHLYTLVIRRNGSVTIMIDNTVKVTSNFLDGFDPPIVPPRQIPDPNAQKPSDWDDREFIVDETFNQKTDTRKAIPDPARITPPPIWSESEHPYHTTTKKPEDWDDELLGEFVPLLSANPNCPRGYGCGQYKPPLVRNPNYSPSQPPPMVKNPAFKGKWSPPLIDNPEFFLDEEPYLHFPLIRALGFELWSVDGEIGFNNILLANDEKEVIRWNEDSFVARARKQKASASPRARVPELRTSFSWVPDTVIGIAVWQILDSWRDMYSASKVGAVGVTVAMFLTPLAILWCCSVKCGGGEYDEEEEASEEESGKGE